MKRLFQLLGFLALCHGGAAAAAGPGVADDQMGLSRTAVSDAPAPEVFAYGTAMPGSSQVLPRAFQNAPPQVPHSLEGLTPVTLQSNACVGCHLQPDNIGKPKVKGAPTPIPASHYTDLRRDPQTVTRQLTGARYVCTQCHAPQAGVPPLVGNSFAGKK
jgi:cytochrome c-type protein NapB